MPFHLNFYQNENKVRRRRPRTLSVSTGLDETRRNLNGMNTGLFQISTTPGSPSNKVVGTTSSNNIVRGESLLARHRRSASYGGGPGETIFGNATRAVEQAEEFMMQLWHQVGRWRVVHYSKLPEWLRDNDYLLWGHRPQLASFQMCFRSIFRIHTETGNIWTHLVG